MPLNPTGLPVEKILPDIRAAYAAHASLLLCAEPGAGKSTVVPLDLLEYSIPRGMSIVMLEPRRIAARAAASRMAALLGEKTGRTVGFRTAFENQTSPETRLTVVTEAILTRMIQHDPELRNIACVIFDEFHERGIHADLALALALDARSAFRPDLKLVLMSATLDTESILPVLGPDSAVLRAEGRCFPVKTIYSDEHAGLPSDKRMAYAVSSALKAFDGDILGFLPGEAEIRRALALLRSMPETSGVETLPLYGTLSSAEQDRVFAPSDTRRVILATPIAETSITLPRVRVVIDSGLRRTSRFSPARGMAKLETERIPKSSAEQRRGRAGRVAEGICVRLWSAAEERGMEEYAPPEILETDLTGFALELAGWGVNPDTVSALSFPDPPPDSRLRGSFSLLRKLHAVDSAGSITEHGRAMLEFPLHPRLAHAMLAANAKHLRRICAQTGAILADRDLFRQADSADLSLRIAALSGDTVRLRFADPGTLDRVRKNTARLTALLADMPDSPAARSLNENDLPLFLTASAWPDRIAAKRTGQPGEFVFANGYPAKLRSGDPLAQAAYLAVADAGGSGEASAIFLALELPLSFLERHLPALLEERDEVVWDSGRGIVRSEHVRAIGSIVLERKQQPGKIPADKAALALIDGIRRTGFHTIPFTKGDFAFAERVTFLHVSGCEGFPDMRPEALLAALDKWLLPFLESGGVFTRLDDLKKLSFRSMLETMVDPAALRKLDSLAPERIEVPSGSHVRIDYSDPRQPGLPVRLQEIFGMAHTPRLAGGKIPLLLDILSPAMRTVQKTADLDSFWDSSYFLVRKDMRGRYPKHDWPENPRAALPHRGVRKPGV